MNRTLSFILLFTLAITSSAQKLPRKKVYTPPAIVNPYVAIDKTALQIPDSVTKSSMALAAYVSTHFATDEAKIRAAFIWIASNIRYDYKNMYFINPYEANEEKIQKPLATRKGICENYAQLFQDVVSKCGIPSYVVGGFTKDNGVLARIGHAWCAAKTGGNWAMYDPTWASNYLENRDTSAFAGVPYFKITPTAFVRSHLPYDFLWQFLNYPVDRQSFVNGNPKPDSTQPYFNFGDTLQAFLQLDSIDQLNAEASRLERNGPMNDLAYERLSYLRNNRNITLHNQAVLNSNQAVNHLNAFIDYRNHRFKPAKPDSTIQSMIDTVSLYLNLAKDKLARLKDTSAATENAVAESKKFIAGVEKRANEEQEWLKRYFAPGKLFRSLRF